MTRDLGHLDAPGGRSLGATVRSAPLAAAERDAESQTERSDEPFALLRAAVERRPDAERVAGAGD